jgi:hypothetical protein
LASQGEIIEHIPLIQKEQWDDKGKIKNFEERKLVLWMPGVTKIIGNKFKFPWEGPYKIHKIFNNNIVELTTMGNDEMGMANINKLKEYCHQLTL